MNHSPPVISRAFFNILIKSELRKIHYQRSFNAQRIYFNLFRKHFLPKIIEYFYISVYLFKVVVIFPIPMLCYYCGNTLNLLIQ